MLGKFQFDERILSGRTHRSVPTTNDLTYHHFVGNDLCVVPLPRFTTTPRQIEIYDLLSLKLMTFTAKRRHALMCRRFIYNFICQQAYRFFYQHKDRQSDRYHYHRYGDREPQAIAKSLRSIVNYQKAQILV